MKKNISKKGFTIIELLVATVIIAILVGIGAMNYERSKAKSRDARRLSDLETIRTGLQLYYDDNQTFLLPTGCVQTAKWCMNGWINDTGPKDPNNPNISVAGYLYQNKFVDKLIKDPLSPQPGRDYLIYNAGGAGKEWQKYDLFSQMEIPSAIGSAYTCLTTFAPLNYDDTFVCSPTGDQKVNFKISVDATP